MSNEFAVVGIRTSGGDPSRLKNYRDALLDSSRCVHRHSYRKLQQEVGDLREICLHVQEDRYSPIPWSHYAGFHNSAAVNKGQGASLKAEKSRMFIHR